MNKSEYLIKKHYLHQIVSTEVNYQKVSMYTKQCVMMVLMVK